MNNESGIITHTELKRGQIEIERSLIKKTPHSPFRQSTIPEYDLKKSDIRIIGKKKDNNA